MKDAQKQLADLKRRLEEILQARDQALSDRTVALAAADAALKASGEKQKATLAQTTQQIAARGQQRREALEQRCKKQLARIDRACTIIKNRITQSLNAERKEWDERGREQYDRKVAEYSASCNAKLERLKAMQAGAAEFKTKLETFARQRGVSIRPPKNAEPLQPVESVNDAAISALEEQLKQFDARLSSPEVAAFGNRSGWGLVIAVSIAHAVAAAVVSIQYPNSPHVFTVLASFIVVTGVVLAIQSGGRETVSGFAQGTMLDACRFEASLAESIALLSTQQTEGLRALEGEEIKRIVGADEVNAKHTDQMREKASEKMVAIRARRETAARRIQQRRGAVTQKLQAELERANAQARTTHDAETKRAQEEHTSSRKKVEQDATDTVKRLAAAWKEALAGLVKQFAETVNKSRSATPSWGDLERNAWKLPETFTEEIMLGTASLSLTEALPFDRDPEFSLPMEPVELPLSLRYPNDGCLFIRSGPKGRDAAMQLLMNTALRLLCSFPAGKAKLMVLDPIGLGQNFGALMHLTDYDESLVSNKIWSDGAHIERKLSELTEHIEKVIQKYLRNRYATVDEFNRAAGQMAEPYRFLFIADFPTALSELALERLASIITSGARCGVYTIIHHAAAQKMPPAIAELALRKNGLFITERDGKPAIDVDWMRPGEFKPVDGPPVEAVDALVNAVGKQCHDAARVQVPFEVAAPKPEEFWSLSTEAGIKLPLGMAGADRLQYLHLGKGTAQHALIAGKTGSGKSNLFHVVIGNAAMWYAPRELEFYLIDFKKGVEFKTYAENQLPHARVIAIESDREFGLSVLRRIDRELTTRGELFRKARVQDFPSYRKAAGAPGVEYLPRSLLMIDEFQELFTDDDGVAQDAALLLDRIVRQGRAFGVHVILGSQTLGGTYTLAKSTLGQMAVRIALQCSEADSYMVLNDDNAAASLLTRPGEAIYNDMSGFVEGNNPFQAVYLPKDAQDALLGGVRNKAVAEKFRPAEPPAIFEGNTLVDLRNNRSFTDAVATGADNSGTLWLGEANAIKGPTEVKFVRQAGSNLLLVGQRGDAALACASAAILSLAATHAPRDVRIVVLDGSNAAADAAQRFAAMTAALPHDVEIVPHPSIPEAMTELSTIVKDRQEGRELTGKSIFVVVVGLERFRPLREDDDFAFSSKEEGTSPAHAFNRVLTDGPNEGVHTLIWCDTQVNLTRTLSRKTLREFEQRVLFQMSANDSSELIDSPAANKLGLYNALLYTAHNGSIEKFRPYSEPEEKFVEDVVRTLTARHGKRAPRANVGPTSLSA